MKIIYNKLIPFKGFAAFNFCGLIFTKKEKLSERTLNHEAIHTAQMKELLYIGFYIWYLIEWLIRLFMKGDAYRNIFFEREAYNHQSDFEYLNNRKHYAFLEEKNNS